jgi:hypothetical protein
MKRALKLLGATALLVSGAVWATMALAHGTDHRASADLDAQTAPSDPALPGSGNVVSVSARDPHGGPAWRVRLAHTKAGRVCYASGRVVNDKFGELDRGGAFNEAPLDGVGVCGNFTPPVDFSVLSGSSGSGANDAITVVTGIASTDVSNVEIHALGQAIDQAPSAEGAFIGAFAGTVDTSNLPVVTATMPDGSQQTFTIDQ